MTKKRAGAELLSDPDYQKRVWGDETWDAPENVGAALARRDEMAGRALRGVAIQLPPRAQEVTSPAVESSESTEPDEVPTDAPVPVTETGLPSENLEEHHWARLPAISEFHDEDGTPEASPVDPEVVERRVQHPTPERLVEALEHDHPLYADIYKTALREFPQIATIRRIYDFDARDDTYESISGGILDERDGTLYPAIIIGEKSPVLDMYKQRASQRLALETIATQAEIDALPDKFWHMYVFAHELGHAIQRDDNFESIFGAINLDFDSTLAYRDYDQYIQSDVEQNADYIASLLMSHSEWGRMAGLPMPSHTSREWREWATSLQ